MFFYLGQDLCEEWGKKPKEEQTFEAFHRAISAAAAHQGGRLKYKVNMLMGVSWFNQLSEEGRGSSPVGWLMGVSSFLASRQNCKVNMHIG